ncbi:hypothetical protein [Methylobacterium durans]|uniref:hypothetical protein n=1 Tax=Methylobacterium durans TaxID=2202825 RepID=UPI0013A59684|nr:hypothetical protein [Methylobacterium durans]
MPKSTPKPSIYVAVFDYDKEAVSVHGPMSDDTEIASRVFAAQKNGRQVNYSSFQTDSVETVTAEARALQPSFRQVKRAV